MIWKSKNKNLFCRKNNSTRSTRRDPGSQYRFCSRSQNTCRGINCRTSSAEGTCSTMTCTICRSLRKTIRGSSVKAVILTRLSKPKSRNFMAIWLTRISMWFSNARATLLRSSMDRPSRSISPSTSRKKALSHWKERSRKTLLWERMIWRWFSRKRRLPVTRMIINFNTWTWVWKPWLRSLESLRLNWLIYSARSRVA